MIYIDESGFAVYSLRIYGYSIKGNRCYGYCDWQVKGRINDIKNAVINRNIILEYLPPYSHDLNPIEKNWLNLT